MPPDSILLQVSTDSLYCMQIQDIIASVVTDGGRGANCPLTS